MPSVTVLMPVCDAAPWVAEAIRSILGQTCPDFSLLIINDGSTDRSEEVIRGFRDPRIELVSRENRGLVATLNEGIERIRTRYIMRMDADDVALPQRLSRQLAFMESHPEVGVCGSAIELFGRFRGVRRYPASDREIKASLVVATPFAHPSVMFRREVLDRHRFRSDALHCEDYRLWLDLAEETGMANLGDALLRHRTHREQVSHRSEVQQSNAAKVALEACDRAGFDFDEPQRELHRRLVRKERLSGTLPNLPGYFSKIVAAGPQYMPVILNHWYELCKVQGDDLRLFRAVAPFLEEQRVRYYDLALRLAVKRVVARVSAAATR